MNERRDSLEQLRNVLDEVRLEMSVNAFKRISEAIDGAQHDTRPQFSGSITAAGMPITPDLVDHFFEVSKFVGTALVGSWVARADGALAQRMLQRRSRGRPATAAQAQAFARTQLNIYWDAKIGANEDPTSQSMGPEGWTFAWNIKNVRYAVSFDNDLEHVRTQRDGPA